MITEIDNTMTVAAAMVFADVFGLGDACRPLQTWLADDGDHVLSATYSGDLEGTMLLAVNSEVAERLNADPERLARGFADALAAITTSSGASLELGDVSSSDLVGQQVVEICDGARRCALLGIKPYSDEPEPAEVTEAPSADMSVAARAPSSAFSAGAVLGESSLLDDVSVTVSVELGRTMMPLHELLGMQPGMVIQLGKAVNDPLDVRVNTRSIGTGSVVTVGDSFGVTIVETAAPAAPGAL